MVDTYPDVEKFVVAALLLITNAGTPQPNLKVVPPFIRAQRVPGGPGSTPWQIRPQIELVHYDATRAGAWALVEQTDALFGAVNPAGGRIGGVFVDRALKVADPAQIVDDNPDLRPVVTVWRLTLRPQPDPVDLAKP